MKGKKPVWIKKLAPENFHELILSFRTAMCLFSGLSFIGIFVSFKRQKAV
ncbi:MAG: hypothetical protein HY746_06675 [Elusimicrobia bacterium]|nr:hypothetical protein [Elusimicrobiota bacterium]